MSWVRLMIARIDKRSFNLEVVRDHYFFNVVEN